MHARTGPGLSRRALLQLALGGSLLVACTSEPEPPPPPDPDDVLRDAAAARERALLREYDAVLLALPMLSARLLPLRGEHAEHLLALTGPERSGSATPAASAVPAPAVPPPATAAAALAGLVTAEREAAAAHGAAALEASRELAGLLASLSASEQSHPVVLG
jgi:hypothetical protein